jgi:hypothetical protein
MEFVRLVLVFGHFLGMAALVGAFFVQLPQPVRQVSNAMLHGALTQLVTGVALVGLYEAAESLDQPVNRAKLGVKLAVILVITALVFLNRRKDRPDNTVFFTIGGLAVLNTAIAVFWT